MKKFLFVVPPFIGHINPTLSIGNSLLERGHEVAWTGIYPLDKNTIPVKGHYYYPEKEIKPYQDEIEKIMELQGTGSNVTGLEILKLALEQTYVPLAKIMMPGLKNVIENFKPDVIINDGITFAGGLAAYLYNIPYATTMTSPPEVMGNPDMAPKVAEWAYNQISGLQKYFGIEEKEHLIVSSKLSLIFTSEEFAGITSTEPCNKFIGPVLGRPDNSSFDWESINKISNPKIFVSIGTVLTDIRKDFFTKLIDAFKDKDVTIIASVDPELFEKWPDNFIVQKYLPQIQLLPHMDAVICHGGFNTINESLMNSLPMVVIPLAYDQFYNASLVENSGSGIRLRYKRMKKNDLENSVLEVLNNNEYRQNAERIKQTFIKAGGNTKAVELLENFAETKNIIK
ncbi:glycosyltransferase [Apibacter raozihei]|uniref:glycosyltransferase n=1 Tax=Apibacter raozihei TaxID=2500547 RepID=UPI000FE2E79D|nr:glycosyltransferase [Apibacter raozihei]